MTQQPQSAAQAAEHLAQPGLSYAPVPPRRVSVGVVVSWVVILFTAGVILASPFLGDRSTRKNEGNFQLKFLGRYVIGIKSVLPQVFGQNPGQLREMVVEGAVSPIDKLRAVPILVEIDGRQAAERALEQ